MRALSLATALTQVAKRNVKAAVVAGDAALRGRTVAVADLMNQDAAKGLVSLLDPAAESPGESLTRLLLTSMGWSVQSQVRLHDDAGLIGRVDFLVAGRVVVEFDGLVKYGGAQGRQELAREKVREDRLRAAGHEVVRLIWRDLHDPQRASTLVGRPALRSGCGAVPS